LANTCGIPIRYHAGASEDLHLVESARGLAHLLVASPQYQDFVRLAREVNENEQVADLLTQLRLSHSSYDHAEHGELVAQLENLPVMLAYRLAERGLRDLCAQVDETVSAAAGLPFSTYVRPQGHG
jgi:cell fate (sporulation/competence/biofilm development) regulator YlbF (YheA/YmcA/DUF963 family)